MASPSIYPSNKGGLTGQDAFVAKLVAAPSAATNLQATGISDTEIDLTWTLNATNQTSLQVLRAPISGGIVGTYQTIQSLAPNVRSFRDTSVSEPATYAYMIASVNASGQSTSLPVWAPAPPTGLNYTAVTQTTITIAWADPSADATSFEVLRKVGPAPYALLALLPAGTTTFSDNSLNPATIYTYEIVAVNNTNSSVGNLGISEPTAPLAVTTLPTAPTAPSGLTATTISQTEIDLSWTGSASGNQTAYKIYRRTGAGAFGLVAVNGPNSTTYADTGLTAGTTYTYYIVAHNTGGDSGQSNQATATTLPLPPVAVIQLVATSVTNTQVVLQWVNPTGNNVAGFIVMRQTGLGGFSPLITLPATQLNYTDTSVSPNTTYSYEIIAFNTGGNAPPSNIITVTTPGTLPQAPVLQPIVVPAPPAGQTQLQLTWTDTSADFTGFIVERQTGAGAFQDVATINPPAGQTTFTYPNTGLTPSTQYTY
jgi:hypothetical protein